MPAFGFETTGNEVVEAFRSRVDGRSCTFRSSLKISRKHADTEKVVITGASKGGFGAETALSLASRATPRLLVLVGRQATHLEPVAAEIKKVNSAVPVQIVTLDLASQASVRDGASKIVRLIGEECDGKLDVLINNAAVMVPPYTKTPDGLELQFGTNHLSHFLLTKLLLPSIEKASGDLLLSRIVNVSSGAHRFSAVRFDDLDFQGDETYEPWLAYGKSKTANILFTRALATRLKSHGVLCYTLHPGSIKSSLQRHMDQKLTEELCKVAKLNEAIRFKTLQQGCSTTLVAALSPEIEDATGAYLDDCLISQAADHATREEDAEKLWTLSEKLIGEKFDV